MLTWHRTAIIRDPIKETDPEIAVGDRVDHQAEVVVPNRKDVPIVNTATTVTIIWTAFPTVNLTVRLTIRLTIRLTVRLVITLTTAIAKVTIEPAVNQKRASNAYYVMDCTA